MITISSPKPDEAKGMMEVIKASWYATYVTPEIGVTKEDIDKIYAQNEAEQIEAFRRRAESPKTDDITLVAKDEDKVVGVIRLIILADHIRVRTMYVHPDYVGQGVGTQLWAGAQKKLPAGKDVIAFPTEHTGATQWYKKMGFVEMGESEPDTEVMPVSGVRLMGIKMRLSKRIVG